MTIADKLMTITDNMQRVFNAGYLEGHDNGVEAGKKAEYDAFWDAYQQNGARVNYSCAFGAPWTAETLRPKHSMQPISALMMFRECGANIDLAKRLDELGVTLDFSKATNLQYLFQNSVFSRVGVIDMSGCNQRQPGNALFAYCSNLKTIDKIILRSGAGGEFSSDAFLNCSALEEVRFDGLITSDVDLHWSTKLSKRSILSIMGSAYEGGYFPNDGFTVTLSRAAVNKAFETSEGANDGSTSAEWQDVLDLPTRYHDTVLS